ncbi:ABC transporter ATP-binding protein [Chloroflexota bacterium]
MALETKGVEFGYGRKRVLEDFDLEINPGEFVGLIGPNGSGKSTVIKLLSHVITPQHGEVRFGGRDVSRIPRRELAQLVSVVPQIPLLPSAFTAFEIVLMGRNPHLGLFQHEGTREFEVAMRAMERTGTEHLARRRINELSGGEIQSLLIARALAQETAAMLLDEPTANLDIGRQAETLEMVTSLCHENKIAVLAALHDLNLAAQYCDRLYLIRDGRIRATGKPAEVITESNIAAVYGATGCVYSHPANGLPMVLLDGSRRRGSRPGGGEH